MTDNPKKYRIKLPPRPDWWQPIDELQPIIERYGIDQSLSPYEAVKQAERIALDQVIEQAQQNKANAKKTRRGRKLPAPKVLLAEYTGLTVKGRSQRDAISILARQYGCSTKSVRARLDRAKEQ